MKIRKLATLIEEIQEDGGRRLEKPLRKVAAVAVIENPFAGRFVDDLQELIKTGEELGDLLGRRAVMALGSAVHSYGKAAIVGVDGEYEHAAAILHPTLGTPFRALVHGGKAIIPSAKKLGGPGTTIDVPLHFKDAAFVRTHFDAMEVRLNDAPRATEILVALVVTDGGRPHARSRRPDRRRRQERRRPPMSAKGAKRPNRSAKKIAPTRSKKRSPGGNTTARSKKSSTGRITVAPVTRKPAPLKASPIKFGLRLPSFALGARTATLAEMGAYLRRAEDLGFDSAVSIDHLLLTPPAYACTWLEPVALLAALAGVTRTIKLGTMVLVLPLRNPAYFAKEWATLDLVSGGRSILGVGVGWHEEEFGLMGVPHKERGRRMDEMLEAVTALWAGDRVSYDGKYYKFRDLTIDPKPLQKPHPPIWIGGGSQPFEKVYGQTVTNIDPVLRRIAKYAKTWVPHSSATADMVKGDWEKIQRFMGDFGRRPGDMSKVYSNFVWVLKKGQKPESAIPALQDLLGDGSALLARVLSAGRSRGAGREDSRQGRQSGRLRAHRAQSARLERGAARAAGERGAAARGQAVTGE